MILSELRGLPMPANGGIVLKGEIHDGRNESEVTEISVIVAIVALR